ncbi:hypothetical protein [Streptomyces liliifuscus]|uniref:Uncharacterized protein n=1 Tax=Streptomyces liliifuscus TaxID=2797636 RepID=A0A7T7KTX7_9ACTN|nr:hypothetical protein [Streptomyces liliifuscus]QQM38627.1 hypothetical protein JEQ17_03520 [Streptomyces liliifuscus]
MDWVSPLSGLVGALIGGGASLYGGRAQVRAQLDLKNAEMVAASAEQEDAERGRIAAALGPRLLELTRVYRAVGAEFSDGRENPDWPMLVMDAELAALEIPDRELRELMADALKAVEHWSSSFRNVNGRPSRLIPVVLDHLMQCLFAWRRGDELPEPSQAFENAQESWMLWIDEHSHP